MIVGTTHLPHIRQTTKRREASLKESVKTFIEHAKRMLKLTHHGLQLLKCKTSLRTKKTEMRKKTCGGDSASSLELVRKKVLSLLLTIIHSLKRLSKACENCVTHKMLISRNEKKEKFYLLL